MILEAIGCVLLLQVNGGPQLDELLRRMEQGASPPPAVSPDVGRAAAARITPHADEPLLERCILLARLARQEQALTPVLLDVIAARGPGAGRATVTLVARGDDLPREVPAALIDTLAELTASDDDPVAVSAAELIGRWGSPGVVSDLLDACAAAGAAGAPRVRALIAGVAANHQASAARWIETIAARTSGDEPWLDALGAFVRDLAARDVEAAEHVVQSARSGSLGPGAVFLRGLGGVGLDDRERFEAARSVLTEYLVAAAEDPGALPAATAAAAVHAAADLLLAELPPLVPALVLAPRPRALRVAAIQALARVGYRDQPTIDLLIPLLADPDREVAAAAHDVLKLKTGQRMAGRETLWLRWRDGARLPDAPPGGRDAWLAEQREIQVAGRRRHAGAARP